MNNFMMISIVVVTLFVMAIVVVDHIEVSRHARMTQETKLQEWKKSFEREQMRAYFDGIGYTDARPEEITNAKNQQNVIKKILKTM